MAAIVRSTKVGGALAVVAAIVTGALVWAVAPAAAADPSADLSVAVTHTPATGQTLDQFTFSITVSNDGPDTAQSVAVGLTTGYQLRVEPLPEDCYRSGEWTSVICEVGDVAAGSERSVDLSVSPRAAGVYTLTAVAASITPDPDTGDLVATDQLLVRRGPLQSERYIAGIFPMVLGRSPDSASLDYWAARWRAENRRFPRRLERIPLGLMNSDEYRRVRIRAAYQQILGRSADAPSLTYWVAKVRAGLSYDAVERTLLASREFAAKNPGDRLGASIAALYGRAATDDEIDRWTAFAGGSTDPVAWQRLLAALQRSTPARDRVIADRVQRTLGIAPTPLIRYVWLVRYREGASTERIWAELLVSWDVLRNYPYTDDDYAMEESFEEGATVDLTAGAPALWAEVQAASSGAGS
jgi:hypothetical protein